MASKLKYLIIHCTWTPISMEVTREMLEKWHLEENGWDRLGYSDIIHRNGKVENLTPYDDDDIVQRNEMTWGCAGKNSVSRHVCLVGGKGFTTRDQFMDVYTSAQYLSFTNYIHDFIRTHKRSIIAGHYVFNSHKECPCFNLPKFLKMIGIPSDKYKL